MSADPSFPILANRLSAVVFADPELSQGAKLTFDAIVMVAKWAQGRTGFCFPSYEALAAKVGRKVRMIGNYLRELRERGYLTWARQQRCPNMYALNLALVSADPPVQAVPKGWRPASAGYKFANGKFNLPGVRELLRGAAAGGVGSTTGRSGWSGAVAQGGERRSMPLFSAALVQSLGLGRIRS